ncbi:MAG TPA: hypothetical protein DCY13_02705 [Verrucomicrobiales bacterium]|nr:hypothetical protein [Verrucomicrobiales bacterium]
MSSLEYPDRHHLNAAAGWLDLDNLDEARAELLKISPDRANHPEVLGLTWQVQAAALDWEAALQTARRHVCAQPDSAAAWIQQSYALHELRRTEEAYRELHEVAGRFTDEGTVAYNLACYTCQLGRLDEAKNWLRKAGTLLGKKAVVRMAADDADLEPLKLELKSL